MRPNFALSLSFDGIRLLHRVASGWHLAGEVALDAADLDDQLAMLRRTALALDPSGLRTKLLIPNEQIRYLALDTAHATEADIEAALDGATPYEVHELVHDHVRGGGRTYVAAVARETLFEAEEFAVEHRFAPVAFAAVPLPHTFIGEAFFGPTRAATRLLSPGQAVERDEVAVAVIGHAHLPRSGDTASEARAPEASADAPAAEAGPGADGAAADLTQDAAATDAPRRPSADEAPAQDADQSRFDFEPQAEPPQGGASPFAETPDMSADDPALPGAADLPPQTRAADLPAAEDDAETTADHRVAPPQAAEGDHEEAARLMPADEPPAPGIAEAPALDGTTASRWSTSSDRPDEPPPTALLDDAAGTYSTPSPRPAAMAEDARAWHHDAAGPFAAAPAETGSFAGPSADRDHAFAGTRLADREGAHPRAASAGAADLPQPDLPQPDLAMAASVAATLAPYEDRGAAAPGDRDRTGRSADAEGVTLSAPLAARLNARARPGLREEEGEAYVAAPAAAPAGGGQAAARRLAFDDRMEGLRTAERRRSRTAPRLLALILTVLLLLGLAAVAAWAALWTEEGLAGLFGRDGERPAAVTEAQPETVAALPFATAPDLADAPAQPFAPRAPGSSAAAAEDAGSPSPGIAGRDENASAAALGRVPPSAPAAPDATDRAALADEAAGDGAPQAAGGAAVAAAPDAATFATGPALSQANDISVPEGETLAATVTAAPPGADAGTLAAAVDLVAAALAAGPDASDTGATSSQAPAPLAVETATARAPQEDAASDLAPTAVAAADAAPGLASPAASEPDAARVPDAAQVAASDAPRPAAARGTVLPPDEAERRYAATGVWQRAPRLPLLPRTETLGDLRLTAAEPSVARPLAALLDSAAVPPDLPALPGPDAEPLRQLDPPPAGAVFERDAQGFVAATPEGAETPQGVLVFAGAPDVRPPARPAPAPDGDAAEPATAEAEADEAAPAEAASATAGGVTLAALRPAARPGTAPAELAPPAAATPIPAALQPRPDLSDSRPRPRPAALEADTGAALAPDIAAALAEATAPVLDNPTARAVPASPRPDPRPQNFATAVTQAIARSATPEAPAERPAQAASLAVTTRPAAPSATPDPAPAPPRFVAPTGPVSGGVATAATLERAINLREINLIGVYGTPNARRALVRLGNGNYVKVGVGDSLDGGQVSAIGDNVINYVKRGRTIALAIPNG